MAYRPKHNYRSKDALERGDPDKRVMGQELSEDFEAISADLHSKESQINEIIQNGGGGGTGGPVSWGDVTGKPTEFPPSAHDHDGVYAPISHTHEIDDVNGLQDALDAAGGTPAWDDVTGKPAEFPPEAHTHEQGDVDGLELRLEAIEDSITSGGGFVDAPNDGKLYGRQSEAWEEVVIPDAVDPDWADIQNKPTEYPPEAHTQGWDTITDKPSEYPPEAHTQGWDTITGKPTEYPPESHTHQQGDIDGLEDKLVDIEGAIGELTGQLAFGGSYDASTGLVVTGNLSEYVDGQPLPDSSSVLNTFVIVSVAGNNPEELDEGDWLVAGSSGWVAIKYGTAGSVAWDNIVDKPSDYPPSSHGHEIAEINGLSDALTEAGAPTAWADVTGKPTEFPPEDHTHDQYLTDAPNDGKQYVRKSEAWAEISTSDGGSGGSIQDGDTDGQVTTWSDSAQEWTPDSSLIVDASGNVGIEEKLTVGDTNSTKSPQISMAGPANSTATFMGGRRSIGFKFSNTDGDLMHIDSSGNVGIGTDNPSDVLEVSSSSPAILITRAGTSDAFRFKQNDGLSEIQSSSDVAINTAGTERMRIDASGNVGIGDNTPSNPTLQVTRTSSIDETSNTNGRGSLYLSAANNSTSSAGQILNAIGFSGQGTNRRRAMIANLQSGSGSTGGDLAFYTTPSNASVDAVFERMRIDTNGRVGIGGEPGTRTIDEAKALAKTKLTEWKAEVKKRTAEQPEASTQEITLEVTDGDFGVMPTEQALAEKLMSRAIGGGDAKLQVSGDGYFSGKVSIGQLRLSSGGLYRQASGYGGLNFGSSSNGPTVYPVDHNGSITNGVCTLGDPTNAKFKDAHFSGTVNAGGDVVAYSDERLKENVETLDGSKVFEMRGVSFDKDGRASSGVIAQELQKVAPELVHDDGEYLSVAYGNLVGYLIEAVKELKAEIEDLKRG